MDNNRNQRDMGALGLLLVLAILGFVAAFLRDSKDVLYGNLGTLVWMGVALAAFIIMILFYAQFLLPKQGQEGWGRGFDLLVRYYLRLAERFVAPPKRESARTGPRRRGSRARRQQRKTAVIPPSFNTVRAGLIPGHQVAAILKGAGFSRVGEPGLVQLYKGERVDKLIDLRVQRRQQSVTATTRDGIPVETEVLVTFQVQQVQSSGQLDRLYPFDKEAIFKVSNFNSQEDGEDRDWRDQLTPRVAGELSRELATYNVDELQHTTGQFSVINEMRQTIQRNVRSEAARHGIHLLEIAFAPFRYPQEVVDQRVRRWQAEWQRRIAINQATGDAEAERLIKQARARAQIEIIERITQSIDAMRQQDDTNLTEIITLRMIEALEEATVDDTVQALIPHQVMTSLVMDASAQMQTWLSRRSDGERS